MLHVWFTGVLQPIAKEDNSVGKGQRDQHTTSIQTRTKGLNYTSESSFLEGQTDRYNGDVINESYVCLKCLSSRRQTARN